jgi:two-component system phosphate regulon sensor histidine kinase PhoR
MRFLPRLYLTYVILVVFAGAVVGVLAILQVRRAMLADVDQRLRQEALHVANLINHLEPTAIAPRLRELGRQLQTRFTVVAPDGTVLGDTTQDARDMENHGHRPEIQAAFANGSGRETRFSTTLGLTMVYHAVAIEVDGRRTTVVRAALPTTEVVARLQALVYTIGLAVALAMSVALLLGMVFGRKITRPLHRLAELVKAFSHGDLSQRVADPGHDEIGILGGTFNEMADQLAERLAIIAADRSQLRAIFSAMIEGITAIDRDERILHINESARQLLDIRPQDVTGRPFWEHCRQAQVCEAVRTVLAGGPPVRRELHLPQPQRDRYLIFRVDPIEGAPGHPAGVVVAMYDITEFRDLERIRRDFVTNASHELKTPLTAVLGMVETILDDPDMPPATCQNFLRGIRDQGRRLNLLIDDLLTLSRIETPEVKLDRTDCDLGQLVAACCRQLAAAAECRKVALSYADSEGPVLASVDAATITTAVENLVDNAIKYTPAGGSVRVTCRREDTGCRIAVVDTGIGITPSHQRRIFERFYRVDKARSRELGGTGLGLAIAKHIVLAHDGRIEVVSQPGAGSTFTIILPAPRAENHRENPS